MFASLAKRAKVSSASRNTKEITAERKIFEQLLMLAIMHDVDMSRVISFPLGRVLWALATADGLPVKTQQAKSTSQWEI